MSENKKENKETEQEDKEIKTRFQNARDMIEKSYYNLEVE